MGGVSILLINTHPNTTFTVTVDNLPVLEDPKAAEVMPRLSNPSPKPAPAPEPEPEPEPSPNLSPSPDPNANPNQATPRLEYILTTY